MGKALETEDNRVDRIKEALATINLYLDEEKYSFDYARVEQILSEAEKAIEQTVRGVRPADLPESIPFSDSLDEDGRSDPSSYAGDMSPEEYDTLMKNYEDDRQRENAVDTEKLPNDKQLPVKLDERLASAVHMGGTWEGPFHKSRADKSL